MFVKFINKFNKSLFEFFGFCFFKRPLVDALLWAYFFYFERSMPGDLVQVYTDVDRPSTLKILVEPYSTLDASTQKHTKSGPSPSMDPGLVNFSI